MPCNDRMFKKELVIIHLNKFRGTPYEKYGMPYGMTQNGIAVALGISRAHACIELQKLIDSEMVEFEQCHIRRASKRMNVYSLTNKGYEEVPVILRKAESLGIELDVLFTEGVKREIKGDRPPLRTAEIQIMEALDLLVEIRKSDNIRNVKYNPIIGRLLEAVKQVTLMQEVGR